MSRSLAEPGHKLRHTSWPQSACLRHDTASSQPFRKNALFLIHPVGQREVGFWDNGLKNAHPRPRTLETGLVSLTGQKASSSCPCHVPLPVHPSSPTITMLASKPSPHRRAHISGPGSSLQHRGPVPPRTPRDRITALMVARALYWNLPGLTLPIRIFN